MIHTDAIAGTDAGTGAGTVTSGSSSNAAGLLPYGSTVTINGSTVEELELLGTIDGSRNCPDTGVTIYRVSTVAGTVVEVPADRVRLAAVPAQWTLELETDDGWSPVPAGPGDRLSGKTRAVPTLDMLYAFALIAAGRARVPGRRVRASIAVSSGLAAWHVEQPAGEPAAYGLVVTLSGGRGLVLSFGTLRARNVAVRVMEGLDQVAGIETFGDFE